MFYQNLLGKEVLFLHEIYYPPIKTDSRLSLIKKCLHHASSKKEVLYLGPSREVISSVRETITELCDGFMHIKVGGFEELERFILGQSRFDKRVIDQETSLLILQKACLSLKEEGWYFFESAHTDGLAEEMHVMIKEMKRGYIKPEDLYNKISSSSLTGDDRERMKAIASVYELYQELLSEKNMMDVDDVSLLAADKAVAKTHLEPVDWIVLDGFINIDRVHREMLQKFMQNNKQIRITAHVPFYTEAVDEFIRQEIITDLVSMGFHLSALEGEPNQGALAAQDLVLNLFNVDALPGRKDEKVHIRDAPCIEDEVRMALKKIKHLLMQEEARPSEIALAVKDINEYREDLVRIAKELSVPLQLPAVRPLMDSPLIKDIIRLIDALAGEGEESDAPMVDFSLLWRQLSKEELGLRLVHFMKEWPPASTVSDYCRQLKEYLPYETLYSLGFSDSIDQDLSKERSIQHLLYIQSFYRLLDKLSFMHKITGDERVSQSRFARLIKETVEHEMIRLEDQGEGVKVLDPDFFRGSSYAYVFFLGLNEGVFPAAWQPGALLPVRLREWAKRTGLFFKTPSWEMQREKIRFLFTCAAAEKGLHLSYRSAAEEGSCLLPSPFLQEAAERYHLELKPKRHMRSRFSLSLKEIASKKEAVEQYAAARFQPDKEKAVLAAKLLEVLEDMGAAEKVKFINTAAAIEARRYSVCPPDEYEGLVEGVFLPQHQEKYIFSASQINAYQACPFKYFLERVLRVAAEEEEEEMTPRALGELYHQVLTNYYQEKKDERELDETFLKKCLEEALTVMPWDRYGRLLLKRKDKEIYKLLQEFLSKDIKYRNKYEEKTGFRLVPRLLEFSIYAEVPEMEARFAARLDRVDFEYDEDVPTGQYAVYDYKKSKQVGVRDILRNEDFQIPLYLFLAPRVAAEHIGSDQEKSCLGVFAYNITESKKNGIFVQEKRKELGLRSKGVSRANWPIFLDYLQSQIKKRVTDIKKGLFMLPMTCPFENYYGGYRCDYQSVCRYDLARLAQKGDGRP